MTSWVPARATRPARPQPTTVPPRCAPARLSALPRGAGAPGPTCAARVAAGPRHRPVRSVGASMNGRSAVGHSRIDGDAKSRARKGQEKAVLSGATVRADLVRGAEWFLRARTGARSRPRSRGYGRRRGAQRIHRLTCEVLVVSAAGVVVRYQDAHGVALSNGSRTVAPHHNVAVAQGPRALAGRRRASIARTGR